LIGIPLRVVISPRTLESAAVEWKIRSDDEAEEVKLSDLIKKIEDFIAG